MSKYFMQKRMFESDGPVLAPVIPILVYVFLFFFLFQIFGICSIRYGVPEEVWSPPRFLGLSLFHLVTITNVLFICYIVVTFYAFVRSAKKKYVHHWVSYAVAFVLLIATQIHLIGLSRFIDWINGMGK
jgi:hypothetical protein